MAKKELAIELATDLKAYSDEITRKIKEAALDVAREAAKDVRSNAKSAGIGGKKYIGGWGVKVPYESASDIRVVICNTKEPSLTHLLKFGHVISNQTRRKFGRTKARPHIKPAEQKALKEFEKKVEAAIRGS